MSLTFIRYIYYILNIPWLTIRYMEITLLF